MLIVQSAEKQQVWRQAFMWGHGPEPCSNSAGGRSITTNRPRPRRTANACHPREDRARPLENIQHPLPTRRPSLRPRQIRPSRTADPVRLRRPQVPCANEPPQGKRLLPEAAERVVKL
jgi:hypothetical protein